MSSGYSYDIIKSEVILFTGAGASCPLGFEALEGLLRVVIDKIREDDRWRRISSALGLFEAGSLEPVLNLEEFLERLDALIALKNVEKEYETTWFSAQSNLEEETPEQEAFFTSQFKSDLEAALELRKAILITIRDHFTKSGDLMERVVDLYQPLFELLKKKSGHTAIPVFTTNYDLALEEFTDRARSYGYDMYGMIDGFDHRVYSRNPPWDPNEYHRFALSAPGTEPTTLILFKLHGSVFWQKSGGRIVFNRQPSPEEIEYVLLYPMQTKTIVEDPFLTCYNYFEECLRNAKLMIAIGYSFGDDYLNQVIARCRLANPELEIMVFNPGFKNPKRRGEFDRQMGVSKGNRVYVHDDYFEIGEQGEELLKKVAVVRQLTEVEQPKIEIPKPYPQIFLSNPKCDKFRETASDSWKPAVVYAEPWREIWQKVARDLIVCGAKWIWIRDRVTDDEAKKGCTVFHKRDFKVYEEFSPESSHAEIVLCIDDEASISVDEEQLGTCKHWNQKIDLTSYLKPGTNTLTMELSNDAHPQDTLEQNPTGVIYKLTIDY